MFFTSYMKISIKKLKGIRTRSEKIKNSLYLEKTFENKGRTQDVLGSVTYFIVLRMETSFEHECLTSHNQST